MGLIQRHAEYRFRTGRVGGGDLRSATVQARMKLSKIRKMKEKTIAKYSALYWLLLSAL